MRAGSHVVEIAPSDLPYERLYANFAALLGVHYTSFASEANDLLRGNYHKPPADTDAMYRVKDAPYLVDVDALGHSIGQAC